MRAEPVQVLVGLERVVRVVAAKLTEIIPMCEGRSALEEPPST